MSQNKTSAPIFGAYAPMYYAKGLPVIPLYAREKKPIPQAWQRYYDHPVEPEQQSAWINQFPDANMGVVLGPQSGIVMLDIDSEDQTIISLIQQLVPASPWQRIGKKGMVLAFKFTGLKTFRIKNTSGETICELLSSRTQVVLPPSIHPDTQMPYKANCDLLEVAHMLPELDPQIEAILRGALEAQGVQLSHSGWTRVIDYASAGGRDTAMVERAGLFAYAIMKGERTLKEAIGMLQAYFNDFVEHVAGDGIDLEKHINNLVRFIHRDVFEKGKILPEGWDEGLTPEEKEKLGLQFDIEHEEWSYVQIRDFLRGEFERHEEGTAGRDRAVDKAMNKIAKSSNLNRLDEDRLLGYIADTSGMGVRVPTLRGRLKELRSGDGIEGTDHTEIARAVIADIEQYYPIRYHDSWLWKWAGSNWNKLEENWVLSKISEGYGHLPSCKRHSDIKGIYSIIKFLVPQGLKTLDIKGINFANGFLTEDLKLMAHDMSYGMTYTLPFRYVPELAGKCPMFWEFLEKSWNEDSDYQAKLDALQESLAVTLFGLGPKYQRAILLQGVAKSGKSQLLAIAASLVPDEARSAVAPNDWGDKFLPTQFHGKLINVAGELPERKLIDGQKFKEIVDGSEMSGQMKGGQIFRFRPVCTHWFASNHYPRTEDTSEGFNRRWLVLQFNKPVKKEDRKLDLGNIIVAEEREAIVAWAVQAVARLKESSEFTLPSSHNQVMREVANVNNSVRFFLQESGKVRFGALLRASGQKTLSRIPEMKIYNAYWSFCIGPGGVKPVGSTAFRAKMRELGTELEFKLIIEDNPFGGQDAWFENIILVAEKAA